MKKILVILGVTVSVSACGLIPWTEKDEPDGKAAGPDKTATLAPENPPRPKPKPTPPQHDVASDLYFIDAHSQMDRSVDEARILSLMDHGGIFRTILSSHTNKRWRDIPRFAKKSGGRIVPAVQLKTGLTEADPSQYRQTLIEQVKSGAFQAMAEMLIYQTGPGGGNPRVSLRPRDGRINEALANARGKGWPFIVHLDFSMMPAKARETYTAYLEELLRKNPDYPFVMAHMGRLRSNEVGRLIKKYPNIYFMMSGSTKADSEIKSHPKLNLFEGPRLGNRFAEPWRRLIVKYPKRFIFAMAGTGGKEWVPEQYLLVMSTWWRALSALPDGVAHAVAHRNAERLWKLTRKPKAMVMTPPWISITRLGPVKGRSEKQAAK